VNLELAGEFTTGQQLLRVGRCAAANVIKDRVINLMRVGLIQETFHQASKVEREGELKNRAEAAAYSAAVLPALHACSADAARAVHDNMKLDAPSTKLADVKRAFEVSCRARH
jgi:hypothetical protein